jgi:hypothetical protein
MAVFRLLAVGTTLAAVAAGALTSAAGPASPSAGAAAVVARATGCASPATGWTLSPPRTVATGQQGLSQPDLAVSRTGRATTTWQGRPHEQALLDVYAADAPGTDGPRSLTAGANVWAMFPSPNFRIGQDARGAQTVMWVQEGRTPDGDGTGYTLTRAGRADRGTWSAPTAVAPEGGLVMGQELVVNASGGGLIA